MGQPWLLLFVLASSIGAALVGLLGAITALLAGLALRRPSRSTAIEPLRLDPASSEHAVSSRPRLPSEKPGEDEIPSGWSSLGERRWDYLPPLSLGSTALARAIDTLVRNRGGHHLPALTPATARAWVTVETASLPLAVYLRQVDDQSGWRALQRERERLPVPTIGPVFGPDRDLGREKLVKVAALVPRWEERGRALLAELDVFPSPDPSLRPLPRGANDAEAGEEQPDDLDAPGKWGHR